MSSTDYDKLRADAKAEVNDELGKVKDPAQRREVAEEIRDQAYMELSMLKAERQRLIAAAALYEYEPQLHEKFGIGRTQVKRLAMDALTGGLDGRDGWINPPSWPANRAEAARKAGVPHPKNATSRAVKIAARYEAAEARRDTALAHLEDVYEELRTVGGRSNVPALARPDFAAIRDQARRGVLEEFAKVAVSDEARLRLVGEFVDQEEEKVADLLPKRDAAVCSLAFYTTARGVYYSAGISRNAMNRILARALGLPRDAKLPDRTKQPAAARAAGVRFVKNAEQQLPDIATEYEAAKARQAAAIEIRDTAIRVMHAAPYGWTPPQIAEAIDRDPKVVRRVVSPDENQT
ncbi:hypothetical protein KUF83_30360 [Streptomyces sp. BV286]|uniref:hypothetical protein n=1 Tax=Streptomyces sp. BV286 TaxID=2849672 RepID=UPI001C2EFDB9|nr:hypothetical protein [Streptomyces sp. BV286]MBV1940840.1 hypothetical protein [Streptomyces sp. BV286]